MNNQLTIKDAKEASRIEAIAANAAKVTDSFSLTKVNDIPALSVYTAVTANTSEKALLVRAKAFGKIHAIFNAERERVSALRKTRKKGDPIPQVDVYGYAKYVDFCEKELNIPRATALQQAKVAAYIGESGLDTIFVDDLRNKGIYEDFSYTQIAVLSKKTPADIRALIADGDIKPSMSVKRLNEILSRGKEVHEDTVDTANTANTVDTAKTADTANTVDTADTVDTAETAKEETPKEYAVKLTAGEIGFLRGELQFVIENSTAGEAIKYAVAILKKIEKT